MHVISFGGGPLITRKTLRGSLWFFALLIVALGLRVPIPAAAQVVGATLSGTVTDASGAAVPQASITVKNVATGIDVAAQSNASGFYTVPNLPPGPYSVTASAPGFATEVRTGIQLNVGAQQALNLLLQVGQVSQTVEVTGEAPAIETSSSSISGVVSQTTVVELPLNGRDWTLLAALQPGVNAITTQQPIGGTAPAGPRRGQRKRKSRFVRHLAATAK